MFVVAAVVLASAVLIQATVLSGNGRVTTSLIPSAAKSVASGASGQPGSAAATPAAPLVPLPEGSPVRGSGAYESFGLRVVSDVPFTRPVSCGEASCQIKLDIYVPAGLGPFPTVVLIRGGPSGVGGRSYLDPFATELAKVGILVFNADYRDIASQGGGYPTAFQDVACAIHFARSEGSRYNGDSGPITLVGHSLGGWVGSVVALDPATFVGGCLADGSGRPDAFVGLAGNYQIDTGKNESDLLMFFGGSDATTAAARAASNPFN